LGLFFIDLKKQKTKIIIAPLNWGIGHATRCVPVINELLKKKFEPIICSDGNALMYLKKEFPLLKTYELPSYNIKYSNKSYLLKLKLLFQIPKIKKAVADEYKVIQQIIKKENINGIISDNRFGVYSKIIPSIYITHQINVLSGITTFFTSKFHQKVMRNFNEIWIPDFKGDLKLAGKLSDNSKIKVPTKYIGVLSRFNSVKSIKKPKYEVLILLSGIEPQRTMLERKLVLEFNNYPKKVLFVRGVLGNNPKLKDTKNIEFVNFQSQGELFKSIINSKIIIARSGYSTIMDLAVLSKKVFFIPTPNQTEQKYLAEHLKQLKISPFSKQKSFNIAMLDDVENYTGFNIDIKKLDLNLNLFE